MNTDTVRIKEGKIIAIELSDLTIEITSETTMLLFDGSETVCILSNEVDELIKALKRFKAIDENLKLLQREKELLSQWKQSKKT